MIDIKLDQRHIKNTYNEFYYCGHHNRDIDVIILFLEG